MELMMQRHFWGWDAPVLDKAVEHLFSGRSSGPLDLQDTLIICPTSESVRRLRQALAQKAAGYGTAVMAPHVWHPETALLWTKVPRPTSTALEDRLLWTRVLTQTDARALPELFPLPPAQTGTDWAAATASTLGALRRTVGAGGLTFGEVARLLENGIDAGRWANLTKVDELFLAELEQLGVQDTQSRKKAAAAAPEWPEEIRRILVFALADPPPLFAQWLRNAGRTLPVSIFIQAPSSHSSRFTELGFPEQNAWAENAVPPLDVPLEHLHLVTGGRDQAALTLSLLEQEVQQGHSVAVGACDASLNAHLEGVFTSAGIRAFDPAGRLVKTHAVAQVLRAFLQCLQTDVWSDWRSFFSLQDVLAALAGDRHLTQERLLRDLDKLGSEHLPAGLAEAVSFSEPDTLLHLALARTLEQYRIWQEPFSGEHVRLLLLWLYGERQFNTAAPSQGDAAQILGEIAALAVSLEERLPAELKQNATLWLRLVLDEVERQPLSDSRGDVDLVLQGWLELLWEPAPALIVTGCNEEFLPGTLAVDPFLPDKTRQMLGLPCQATRRARDAYMLRALYEQRRATGNLHLVLGRVNDDNDALKPSRLLFDVPDEDLPDRVRHFFPRHAAEQSSSARPAPTLAWKLRPRKKKARLDTISVSRLKNYLACPFRFYLRSVLGMRPVAAAPREMDRPAFGEFLHAIFCQFGREASIRESTDESAIRHWLETELHRRSLTHFGSHPLFSVALQLESMRQRLDAFAELQAAQRREGWKIAATEVPLREWGFLIAEVPLVGSIDRIDYHEGLNAWRVWDYKSGNRARTPAEAHIEKARSTDLDDPGRTWMCFLDAEGKEKRWVDLQLPIYAQALRHILHRHGGGRRLYHHFQHAEQEISCPLPCVSDEDPVIETGYWNLPSAVGDAQTCLWVGVDEVLMNEAGRCAATAVERIRADVFWPPSVTINAAMDDFAGLFAGDPLHTVHDPSEWKGEGS